MIVSEYGIVLTTFANEQQVKPVIDEILNVSWRHVYRK